MHRVGIVIAALLVAAGALVLSLAPEVTAAPSAVSSSRDVVEGTADLTAVLTGDALDAAANASRTTVIGPLAALAVLLVVALVVADRRVAALPPPADLRLRTSARGGSVGRRAPPAP